MPVDSVKIAILAENTTYKTHFYAEHGLSFYIEKGDTKILFDTGQSDLFIKNAQLMDIQLKSLDAIFMSHGHYDHTGGLVALPGNNTPIYAHPDIFIARYTKKKDGTVKNIGIPVTKERLEEHGFQFLLNEKCTSFKGFTLTGEIPRKYDFEIPSQRFYLDSELKHIDSLLDDQSLYFNTKKGLVVLLGCCHTGIINTLFHILEQTKERSFYWIIGGTHLIDADAGKIKMTACFLNKIGFKRITPLHCSGIHATAVFKNTFGDRFHHLSCGDICYI